MNTPQPLQLDYPVLLLTWPFGDWCIYCSKDSQTCEHFEQAEREAMIEAKAEDAQ